MEVAVGIDSADSPYGGCTTHALYGVFKRLFARGLIGKLLDYPLLVRLNPAVPGKTRGNGAVALRFKASERATLDLLAEEVASEVMSYVSRVQGDVSKVGVVITAGNIDRELYDIYLKALTDFVHLDYVRTVVDHLEGIVLPLGLNKGCVGALAAIGWSSTRCTYELLIYRHHLNAGRTERSVDVEILRCLDLLPEYTTFCSYDHESNRAIAVPRGPDPVLLGIRGLDPEKLVNTLNYLRLKEPIEGWMVFKTNQATGDHMVPRASTELKPFRTGCVAGKVEDVLVIVGGDVLLLVNDGYGKLKAVVFKETGLAPYAGLLEKGDVVRFCGTIKVWDNLEPVLHAEYLEVLDLAEKYLTMNPRCPRCGKRLKSAGKRKGYKCPSCGFRSSNLTPEVQILPRELSQGVYLPSCASAKHLSIPKQLPVTKVECVAREPKQVSDFYNIQS